MQYFWHWMICFESCSLFVFSKVQKHFVFFNIFYLKRMHPVFPILLPSSWMDAFTFWMEAPSENHPLDGFPSAGWIPIKMDGYVDGFHPLDGFRMDFHPADRFPSAGWRLHQQDGCSIQPDRFLSISGWNHLYMDERLSKWMNVYPTIWIYPNGWMSI